MVACNSNSTKESADINVTEQGDEQEAEETSVKYTSYSLLKEYKDNPEALIASLKGKDVTITDVIFRFANVYEVEGNNVVSGEGPGYMESHSDQIENHFLGYSSPSTGAGVIVDGDEMPEQKDVPYGLEFLAVVLSNSITITEAERVRAGDDSKTIFHTQAVIEIEGDQIEGDNNSLHLKGGTITSVKHF